MSFTDIELEYLAGQRLGRLATAQPDGTLQVSPVGFRYNKTTGTIDIAGRQMARSRKFRNVAENGQVAFVIDDFVSLRPWLPRCVEIRGTGEAITEPTDSAWLLAQHPWIVPIPGTRRLERVEENAAATLVPLSADELADLDDLATRIGVRGDRYDEHHMSLVGH